MAIFFLFTGCYLVSVDVFDVVGFVLFFDVQLSQHYGQTTKRPDCFLIGSIHQPAQPSLPAIGARRREVWT